MTKNLSLPFTRAWLATPIISWCDIDDDLAMYCAWDGLT